MEYLTPKCRKCSLKSRCFEETIDICAALTRIRKAEECMKSGTLVRSLEDKLPGLIKKIDPTNKRYTFLLRFKDGGLKWISFNSLIFGKES